MFFTLMSLLIWLQVIVLGLVAYIADANRLPEDSKDIQLWK